MLDFRFRVVQLNQFRWRDYLQHPNPLATALLTRMRVAPHERRAVKAACLAHLVGLPISAKRRRIISQFLDVYLPLAPADEAEMYAAHPEIAPSQPEVPADLSACQGVLTWLSAHLSVLVHACNVCDVASYLIEFTQENLSAPPRITTSARPGSVGAGLAAPAGSVGCAQPVQYAGRLPICIGSDTDANPRDLARDQRLVRRLGGVGYPWAH
ncbi:MAG: hypothetical protein RMJ55_16805 [Roseiflexaceae bacterium]|nr:hypothetical protein [Roseiflexaceae bacterium]